MYTNVTYTTKQNYKGLWEITIKKENGFTQEIRTFVTKAKMLNWIKENL